MSVHECSPTDIHFGLVKRIIRYLYGTIRCGLTFTARNGINIKGYSDSDWVANVNTHISSTGYVVYLGDNLIS